MRLGAARGGSDDKSGNVEIGSGGRRLRGRAFDRRLWGAIRYSGRRSQRRAQRVFGADRRAACDVLRCGQGRTHARRPWRPHARGGADAHSCQDRFCHAAPSFRRGRHRAANSADARHNPAPHPCACSPMLRPRAPQRAWKRWWSHHRRSRAIFRPFRLRLRRCRRNSSPRARSPAARIW